MAEHQRDGRTRHSRTHRAAAALGTALLVAAGISVQTGDRASAAQNPTACQPAINLVNGDFEQPVLPSTTYRIMNQSQVPGWQTTATDSAIELWSTGFNGVPSYSGNQFAELNANQVSQLYQLVPTIPGTIIHWRLRHRGRAGTDVMVMRIGSQAQGKDSPIVGAPMSDGTSAWGTYSGTYVVPPGQTMTHLGFDSISAAGGASVGNFLDDIFIGTSPCIVATKSVLDANGAPIPDMTNVNVGDVLTYRINAVNPGGDVATATVLRDTIPAGTTYMAGSLRVLTGPNTGAKTDVVDADQGSVVGRNVTVYLGTGATGTTGGRLANDDTLVAGTTVELKVRVATSAAGPLTNTATISFVDLYDNEVHTPRPTTCASTCRPRTSR